MHGTTEITLTASAVFLFGGILLLAVVGAAALGIWYGRRHAPDDSWTHPPQAPEIDMKATALLVPCEERPAQPPRPALGYPRLAVPHENVDVLPAPVPVGHPAHADAFMGALPVELPVNPQDAPQPSPVRSWAVENLWGGRDVKQLVRDLEADARLAVADYSWKAPAVLANARQGYGTYYYRGATLLV